jgi:hypothetical protein
MPMGSGAVRMFEPRPTVASDVRVAAIGGSASHTKVSSIPSSDRSGPAHLVSCVGGKQYEALRTTEPPR